MLLLRAIYPIYENETVFAGELSLVLQYPLIQS